MHVQRSCSYNYYLSSLYLRIAGSRERALVAAACLGSSQADIEPRVAASGAICRRLESVIIYVVVGWACERDLSTGGDRDEEFRVNVYLDLASQHDCWMNNRPWMQKSVWW